MAAASVTDKQVQLIAKINRQIYFLQSPHEALLPILCSIENAIYELFKQTDGESVDVAKFLQALRSSGISISDPRLHTLHSELCRRGLTHESGGENS